MKRFANIAFLAFLIILGVGLYIFNSNVHVESLQSDDNLNFEKGTVVKVTENNAVHDQVNGGSQTLEVKITSGNHKGKTCTASNMNGYLYGTYCKEGTKVVLQLSEHGNDLSASVYGFDRGNAVYIMVLALVVILWIVGGRKGLKSVIALGLTFILIIFLYIPLLYIGTSPFWAAVLVVGIITIVSIYLICGYTRKGVSAILGTLAGVLMAGIFAKIFGKISRITGYNIEDIETMIYVAQNSRLQVGGMLFSGILIASLGAVMDVAVSISATIEELHNKNPLLTSKELFKSGITVGKDMMGTMSNTLILAFTGGAINIMVIIYAYCMPYLQVLNMYSIGIEIIKGISGTLGIILTVPFVSFVAANIYRKK